MAKDTRIETVTGLSKEDADRIYKQTAERITDAGNGRTQYVTIKKGLGGWRVSLWQRG